MDVDGAFDLEYFNIKEISISIDDKMGWYSNIFKIISSSDRVIKKNTRILSMLRLGLNLEMKPKQFVHLKLKLEFQETGQIMLIRKMQLHLWT